MACGSIFEVLQYFCFKYTNMSSELMLCIHFLLVFKCVDFDMSNIILKKEELSF